MVCAVVTYTAGGAATATISDGVNPAYTTLTAYGPSVNEIANLRFSYSQGGTYSNGMTMSVTSNMAFYSSASCAAFSGVASSPFDSGTDKGVSWSGGATTTFQPGSATPSTNSDLFVTASDDEFGNGAGGSACCSPATGFSAAFGQAYSSGNAIGVWVSWKIKSSDSTAENPTWTTAGSISANNTIQAAFTAGGGGGVVHCVPTLATLGVSSC